MNTDEQKIHHINPNGNEIDRNKFRVLYKPRIEGNREIFSDDQQYMRRVDGSLVRITKKSNHGKSKKERSKEKRQMKRSNNENNN